MGRPKPTGRPRIAETAALKNRVVELRNQSYKWREIAQEVGRSIPYCHNLYFAAMREVPAEAVVQARTQEGQLVESAVRSLLRIATDETEGVSARTRVEAWNSIRGWSEHRARMFGLNAPVKSQVNVILESQVDEEIKRLKAEMALRERGRVIEHEALEAKDDMPAELLPPEPGEPIDLDARRSDT